MKLIYTLMLLVMLSIGSTLYAQPPSGKSVDIVEEQDTGVDQGKEAFILEDYPVNWQALSENQSEEFRDDIDRPLAAPMGALDDCLDADPFCSHEDLEFPNSTSSGQAPSGPDYGCFHSQPNPVWYYLKIGEPGILAIDIVQRRHNGILIDVDFVMWGPFTSLEDGCVAVNNGVAPLQFSYSTAGIEHIGIGTEGGGRLGACSGISTPPPAQTGEIYIVMMTNYSGNSGTITLEQTNLGEPGAGTTDCSIVFEDELVACEGEEVILESEFQGSGISYEWSEYNPATDTYDPIPGAANAPIYTVTENGIYMVETTGSGERKQEIFTVTFSPHPELNLPDELIFCKEDDRTLDATPINASAFGTLFYEWLDENGNTVGVHSSYEFTESGIYTVIVRGTIINSVGKETDVLCEATHEIEVVVSDFEVDLGDDQDLCQMAPIDLFAEIIGDVEVEDLTFEWSGPGVSGFDGQEVEVSETGLYGVTVTDEYGCTATDEVTVDYRGPPEIEIYSEPDSICPGQIADISIIVSTDGDVQYKVVWDTPIGEIRDAESISTETPGSYIVEVIDEYGCISLDTFYLAEGIPPEPIIIGDSLICEGGTATLSTLNDDYDTYRWSTGDADQEITVTSTGEYSVTVTTSSGCKGEASFILDLDDSIIADAGPTVELTCDSLVVYLDGSSSSQGPEYEYEWTSQNGEVISTDIFAEADEAGRYTILVRNTETGCEETATVIVTSDFEEPRVDAGSEATIDCNNTTAIIGSNGNPMEPGFEIIWTNENGDTIAIDEQFVEVDSAGQYMVTVRNLNNGCTSSDVVTVIIDQDPPAANAGEDFTLDCEDSEYSPDTDGSSTGNEYRYSWATGDGHIVNGHHTLTPTFDEPGQYILEVVNTRTGCSSYDTVYVESIIVFPRLDGPQRYELTCYNQDTTLFVEIVNFDSEVDYRYLWTTPDGNVVGDSNDSIVVVNAPGTYTVVVTNTTNHCEESYVIVVMENTEEPVADAGPDAVLNCFLSEVTIGSSNNPIGPGFEITWTDENGNTIVLNEQFIKVDTAGRYTITVIDLDNGCINSDEVSVIIDREPPKAIAGDDFTLDCESYEYTPNTDGSSTGNYYRYSWTTGDGHIVSGHNTLSPTFDEPGQYILEVMNTENGCTSSDTVKIKSIIEYPELTGPQLYELTCFNQDTTLYVEIVNYDNDSHYKFSWTTMNGNIINGRNDSLVVVNAPGTYTVVVVNSRNHCDASYEIIVVENTAEPIADAGLDAVLNCYSSLVTIGSSNNPNSPGYEIIWTDENGDIIGVDVQFIEVDSPGRYTITVRDLKNGCKNSDVVTVTVDIESPQANAGDDFTLDCKNFDYTPDTDGSSMGFEFQYSWTTIDGHIVSGHNTLSPTFDEPGEYILTVLNTENGCSASDTVYLESMIEFPILTGSQIYELNCYNQDTTLLVEIVNRDNNTEYQYLWTTLDGNILGDKNDSIIVVDAPGTYTVHVTNNTNHCEEEYEIIVIENFTPPIADAGPPAILDCINPEVTIGSNYNPSGPGYNITWTTDDGNILGDPTGQYIYVNAPGKYIVTVVDVNNGCESTDSVIVDIDDDLPIAVAGDDAVLNCENFVFTPNTDGSSTGSEYSYYWTTIGGNIIAGGNSLNPTFDQAGNYILEVINTITGCASRDTVNLDSDIEDPILYAPQISELNCYNSETTLSVEILNYNGGYSFEWNTSNGHIVGERNDSVIVVDAPGSYIVTVTDIVNHCTEEYEIIVIENFTSPVA